MKYFKLFCITLLLLLLTSCQNFFSSSDDLSSSSKSARNYVSFTGNICLEGAYPQELVSNIDSNNSTIRTAFPALPDGAVYRVTAEKNGTLIYDSSQNNTDIQIAADKSSFTIKQLATGANWNITVAIYESSDTDFSAPLMSDSYPFTPSEENNVLTHDFELKPVLTGGKGSVSLILTYPAGAFDDFSFTCLSSNSDKWTCLIDNTLNNCVILCNTNGDNEIETGSYVIQFDFKKAGIVLYSDIQTINIFKNMQTKHWVNNGGSETIKSDGTYEITQAMIDDFALTQIYVGTNSWGTASPNGTGSRFAPFDTLQKAIDYIGVAGKSTKNYTIWVSGGVNGGAIQGNTTLGDSLNGKSKSITIRGLNGLNEDWEPLDYLTGYADKLNNVTHNNNDVQDYNGITVDDIFETGEFAPVLKIYSSDDITLDVRLKDIGISKGAARQGAGIHLYGAHVKLTINEGTLISDNHSSFYAGGLYVDGSASCIMNGGKITENSTYNSSGASSGGGIEIENGGSFTMNAGEISNNRAMNFGGGVSLRTSPTATQNQSRFTMNGGKISGNYANGVTPAPNYTKSGYGGAVYIHDGTFTMKAGEISGNYTNCEAGAVYIAGELDTSAAFDMQGGIIKENTLNDAPDTSKCSGIYLRSKAFKIKGNSFIPKSNDKHIIYLASGKTIDINGTLTPTSDGTASGTAENVAAVINLADTYTADLKVLTGSNSSNVNSASGKMRMTNQEWCISQGKLIYGVIATAAELKDILTGLNTNNKNTPYNIMIYDAVPDFDVLKEALYYGDKYVNLSFPNATFSSMSTLGLYSFYDEETHTYMNYGLKVVSVTIPASVTSCVFNSSGGYAYLKNIDVESGNTAYKSIDGVLYSYDEKVLICLPRNKELEGEEGHKTYIIPNTVETINTGAMARNEYLTYLDIPGNVKTLKSNAVYWCEDLTSVTFAEGLESIEGNAFTDTKVTSFTIPASVTNIEIQPFALNAYSTLQNITVSSSNTTYYSYDGALYKPENNKLTIIHCPPKKTVLKIKDNITHKGGNAFWYGAHNSTLTTIVFEEGVTEIKIDFKETTLSQVTDIYLPSTITKISSSLFNSTKIKNVYYAGTEDNRNSNTQLKNFLNVLGITWHYSTSYTGD